LTDGSLLYSKKKASVIFVPLPDLRVAHSSTNISEKRFVL
jgi:hypothetical protein